MYAAHIVVHLQDSQKIEASLRVNYAATLIKTNSFLSGIPPYELDPSYSLL